MPRQVSENENEIESVISSVTFCPETGRRLSRVRFDTDNGGFDSRGPNTKAQTVVRALWESDPENPCNHKSVAESVISNLKERAVDAEPSRHQNPGSVVGDNFKGLKKRTSGLPIRRVRRRKQAAIQRENIEPKLRRVIEEVVDDRIAQLPKL